MFKSKNGKILLILLVAIITAVLGGFSLYTYLTPQKTTVYVFKENYEAGTNVTEDMLTPVSCDSNILVAGSDADINSMFVTGNNIQEVLKSGDALRIDVAEGMPLTQSILSIAGGTQIEQVMDPSKIAVTIPVDNVTGVTETLQPGSRVNIYATGLESEETQLLMENMRVLSVHTDNNGGISSATIEVTQNESLKLIYAATNASLYLGLVNSSGYQVSGS